MFDSSNFPFLKLPLLAIRNAVHHMDCTAITELSLCSRRSKILMQSMQHPEPTHIELTIDRLRMYVALLNGIEICSLWSIKTELIAERCRKYYRDDIIRGVCVAVLKLGESRFRVDAPFKPEKTMKALVDHLKDVFKLPLEVNFKPNKMKNFLRFLPVFPVCKRFYFHATEGVSEEELKFVKDYVAVEQRAYYYTSQN